MRHKSVEKNENQRERSFIPPLRRWSHCFINALKKKVNIFCPTDRCREDRDEKRAGEGRNNIKI
jgi:hypothetical protein